MLGAFIMCGIRFIEFYICPPSSHREDIKLKFQAQSAKTSPLALQPNDTLRDKETGSNTIEKPAQTLDQFLKGTFFITREN